MSNNLLEKIIIAISFIFCVFRKTFTDGSHIEILMLGVNGLALWASFLIIFDKANGMFQKRMSDIKKSHLESKAYDNMVKVSNVLSVVLFCVITFVSYITHYLGVALGDYITIITLCIALTDGFLSDKYCDLWFNHRLGN